MLQLLLLLLSVLLLLLLSALLLLLLLLLLSVYGGVHVAAVSVTIASLIKSASWLKLQGFISGYVSTLH